MQISEVFHDEQMIVGEWYWIESKTNNINHTGQPRKVTFRPYQVVNPDLTDLSAKSVSIGGMNMWCHEGNSQFFDKFRAYGPIIQPNTHEANPGCKEYSIFDKNEDNCVIAVHDNITDDRSVVITIETKRQRSWAEILCMVVKCFTVLLNPSKEIK